MGKPIIGITTERWSSSTTIPNQRVQGALASYLDAVRGAGGLPVLIPLALDDAELDELYPRLDGILVPGGGDIDPAVYHAEPHATTNSIDADRDRIEMRLTRQAIADHKPFFGICRGIQVFNVALGGTLYQDLPSEYPSELRHYCRPPEFSLEHAGHSVRIEADTLLARAVGQPLVEVNSRHHQALKDLAPGLQVVARASDNVVEAVEVPGHPFALGVQWHPENLQAQPEMKALFRAFVRAAEMKGQP